MTALPEVRIWRDPKTGKLWFKLPVSRARWKGPHADMTEVSLAIAKEGFATPYSNQFVMEKSSDGQA